jgi:acetone carboxylase gamma subunit
MGEKEVKPVRVYRCLSCGAHFKPRAICPRCGHNITVPTNQIVTPDLKLFEDDEGREMTCPKCKTIMRVGFTMERDSPIQIVTFGTGLYWSPGEGGLIGTRVSLKAYICPECGYLEQYARRLNLDKDTILSAPTK